MATAPAFEHIMAVAPEAAPVNAWDFLNDNPGPEYGDVGMGDDEIVAILRREEEGAENEWEYLAAHIEHARRYYESRPFGNEIEGRSQVILPDVQESCDYMAQSVLNVFEGGGKVVEFEAADESDEDAVDDASEAITFNFRRQQDGYRMLHDWAMSGLIDRMSVAKTMVVTEERVSRQRVTFTDPVELQQHDGDIEGVEERQDGTAVATIKTTRRRKRFVDMAVPIEEFRWSSSLRHEDDGGYTAHVALKTRSKLVEMGFDPAQVYSLPAHSKLPVTVLSDRDGDGDWQQTESSPALEQVLLREEYPSLDIDGDGIAELVRVFRVENEILRFADPSRNPIETVDENPWAIFCAFFRPHRIDGYSMADKTMDIQLGRSTIARQLFDGMYNSNMPRPIIDENSMSDNTIGDVLSPIPGSPIRVRGGAASVQPYQTNFNVGQSLEVLGWMTSERESRTSITRLNRGIDKDALNDTAAGQDQLMEKGAQTQEFVARNLAEAFSRLMAKKYRLMRREADPFPIKVDGQYRQVDPATWPEDMYVSIKVGLGTGTKEKRIQARMMLAPFLAEGFQNKQVTPQHLYHAVDGLVRDLGIGKGDDFWVDPDAPPETDPQTGQPKQPEPPQPDPEMLKMQAEQQREAAKLQLEQQKAEQAAQLAQQKAEADVQVTQAISEAKIAMAREEAAAKLELERAKAQSEADMNMQRMSFEQAMAVRQAEFNERMAEKQADHAAGIAETKVQANRPGGDLDK